MAKMNNEEFDTLFKSKCKEMKEQIVPSDEFTSNLKKNLEEKLKENSKCKNSPNLISSIKNFFAKPVYKFATVFTLFVVISSYAFAGGFNTVLSSLFSNVDEAVQVAFENGYVQNIDMDYVESNGIKVKALSLIIDKNRMDIVFEFEGDLGASFSVERFSIMALNSNNKEIDINKDGKIYTRRIKKSIDANHKLVIFQITNISEELENINQISVKFNNIVELSSDYVQNKIYGDWIVNIDVDDKFFTEKNIIDCNYMINSNEQIKDYKIIVSNTGTYLNLLFDEKINIEELIKDEKVYAIGSNGKKYYPRECYYAVDNRIYLTIPLLLSDKVDSFNIFITNSNVNVKVEK